MKDLEKINMRSSKHLLSAPAVNIGIAASTALSDLKKKLNKSLFSTV